MDLVGIAAGQIATMFFILVLAFICYKGKILKEGSNKVLSDVLLHLINPILIFVSYQTDFEPAMLQGLGIAFIMAVLSHLVFLLLAKLLVPANHNKRFLEERCSLIYTNCGFFGIPLVNGIFGAEGVLYLTAYVTIFNLLIWTHCVSVFSGKTDLKSVLKVLKSPTILAIIIGLPMLIFQIRLPELILRPLEMIEEMNTPIAMLVAGISIAQSDLGKLVKNFRLFFICFLKMLVFPLISMVILKVLFGSTMVSQIIMIAGACPSATMVTMFALEEKRDATYCSEIFALTTLLSAATIPLMIYIFQYLQNIGF